MDIFSLFKQIEKENAAKTPVTHMIVGLGNPGDKYEFTRHNAGFLALSCISQKLNVKIDRVKFKGLTAQAVVGGKRTLLLLPQTFMNNSGESVRAAADFYKIEPQNILVLFDDISLDVGRMRIRKKGSAGGHNGIKSIIAHMDCDEFPRVKIGVGQKPHAEMELADWVLSKFTKDEQKTLFDTLGCVNDACNLILSGKCDEAMNKYNS